MCTCGAAGGGCDGRAASASAAAVLLLVTPTCSSSCRQQYPSLLPRKLGLSRKRRVDGVLQARLQLVGVVLLLLIIPLRRVLLAGKGGATLAEVVGSWGSYPLARQQELFSLAVLAASGGRWDELEGSLSLALDPAAA